MKYALFIAVFLGCVSPLLANDMSMVGVGGSWHPLRGEHSQIRMESETVDIDLGANQYTVTADFTFRNQGDATTVEMGFPESGGGAEVQGQTGVDKSTFLSFSSQVDGQAVPVQRVALHRQDEEFEAAWVKEVRFDKNQTRHIRVHYSSPLGGAAAMGNEQMAAYDFTGGNWAGDVGSSVLKIHFNQPGVYLLNATLADKAAAYQVGDHKTSLTFNWHNWQAQGKFKLRFMRTAPGWMISTYHPEQAAGLQGFATLTVPGKWSLGETRLDWLPPAFGKDGVVLVGLNVFYQLLRERFAELHPALTWNAATRTGTLYVRNQSFAFQPESRIMKSGATSVTLPAAAMMMQWGSQGNLYVPLAPLVQALGGNTVTNAAAHRFRFYVPEH